MRRFTGLWGRVLALAMMVFFLGGLAVISIGDIAHKRAMTAMVSALDISPMLLPIYVPERHERLAHQAPAASAAALKPESEFGAYDPKQLTRSFIPNKP